MQSERWQQIKDLFAGAEDLPAEERGSFLGKACGDDAELRREVEHLLQWRGQADTFLEDPADLLLQDRFVADDSWELIEELLARGLHATDAERDFLLQDSATEVAATVRVLWETQVSARSALLPGDELGRYQILSRLACGGMGEVYAAHDPVLSRNIAIKVLPVAFGSDDERVHRMYREGRAASACNHPNILTVHEIGEIRGRTFLATELVEGETLRARMTAGVIEVNEALRIAIEIAKGLQASHEKGTIHRDIKPSNIMILPDGHVKILDFGLAPSRADSAVTDVHAVMGSPAYMSPEQMRGEPVDAATDIWSVGILMYEMLAGRLPSSFRLAAGQREKEFAPVSSVRTDVPRAVDSILARCTAQDPCDRYSSAADLLCSLQSVQESGDPARVSRMMRAPVWALATAALTLFTVAGFWMWRSSARTPRHAWSSVAVLPFRNVSINPDQEPLANGITKDLTAGLSKIGSLRVIPRTSAMRYKNTEKSLPEVARELHVDSIIGGSVMQVDNRVRVTAKLIHADSNEPDWVSTYDRPTRDVTQLQGEFANAIAASVRDVFTPESAPRLADGSVPDRRAYDLYLRGHYLRNEPGEEPLRQAVVYFTQATRIDPRLALAQVGIANSWFWLSSWYVRPRDAMPFAKVAAQRALEINANLSDAHSALGNVAMFYEWDWPAAEQHFRKAIALDPDSAAAHGGYADYLLSQRRFDEAFEQGRTALNLDPFSFPVRASYLLALVTAGRNDDALAEARRALDLEPGFSIALAVQGLAESGKNLHDKAVRSLEKAVAIERTPTNLGFLAYVEAAAGKREAALAVLQELKRIAATRYVCPFEVAMAYVALEDLDEAFRWMQNAVAERADCLAMLTAEPWFDALRADVRYYDLLRKTRLQATADR